MIDRFEILGAHSGRPDARGVIFCDGAGGRLRDPTRDLDLSHWRPNQTPKKYRAGTSTEICFKFLDDPAPGHFTVAVNNHVDVDGILSVYVLLHPDEARERRSELIEAAEMGDFWGWAELPAQRLFQALTLIMQSTPTGREAYLQSFRRIPGLVDGTDASIGAIDESLAPLSRGVRLVERGRVERRLLDDRLAHYVIPLEVAREDDSRAAHVPEFNELISDRALFWPQVRARYDAQRACLVSTERGGGWFHDLWLPGYLWADTQGLWRVPAFEYHDGMSSYALTHAGLLAAFDRLQALESAPGLWCLGGTSRPFGSELQQSFPLVGRFLSDQGLPARSALSPAEAAAVLTGGFDKGQARL
jgi:hypothetical protein